MFVRFLSNLTLLIACLISLSAVANDKVPTGPAPGWLYPIAPDLHKTADPRKISEGYYLVLMDEQTNLTTNTEYTHFIRQIVNESGIQNGSEVSVTYFPAYQQLTFHMVRILRSEGNIDQLKPELIKVVQQETDAANFQYTGEKRAYITLKDIRKGDRIEVSWSLTGFNPVFGNKYSDKYYFAQHTAICNYYKTLITASDRKLIIKPSNNAPAPIEHTEGNRRIYHWDNPPLQSFDSESNMPSWFDNYPYVAVTDYSSWQQVAEWGTSLLKNYSYQLPQGLLTKIQEWKKQAGGDKDVFGNLATHFVQDEVRYLGLEIGPGTHQPRPPAEVYAHRYGDCKDKSLLLAAILRAEGISASVALVNTDTRDKLVSATPSPDEFNHAIVAIERSKDVYTYIDPTISGQRGDFLTRYLPPYGYALLLQPGTEKLQPIPAVLQFNYDITESLIVSGYDTSTFTVNTVCSGGAADKQRDYFSEMSLQETEEGYRKYYAEVFDGIQLSGPIITEDDSLKNIYRVKETYIIPHIWNTKEAGKKTFDFTIRSLSHNFPDPPSDQTASNFPLALSFPREYTYRLQITMPEDWQFNETELHIKNGSYQFDFTPSISYNHISLLLHLKTFRDHIPVSELAQYKDDYTNIMKRLSFQLYQDFNAGDSPSPDPARHGAEKNAGGMINWAAVCAALVLAAGFTWIIRRLNTYSETHSQEYATGYPLSGWTIVLGVTLVLGLIWRVISFARSGYFSHTVWARMGELGGAPLQGLLMTELLINLLLIGSQVAVMYWYLGKRDIFPRMFTWFITLTLSAQLLLILLCAGMPLSSAGGNLKENMTIQFFRFLIYGGIWVTYLRRSANVKMTFIQPYKGRKD